MGDMEIPGAATADREAPDRARVEPRRSAGRAPASGSGTSSPGSGGTEPPTAGDLGIDPNSGAYIEYQPSLNQVVITYPDGTTETRPWPAQ